MSILIGVVAVSIVANVITIIICEIKAKENSKLKSENIRVQSELEYYMELDKIKKEVRAESEEKIEKLNSGDIHSRNNAAADILRNDKG